MHNSDSHKSPNFTNIWGLSSNFIGCESFLESNSPNILALCETNFDDSIDSSSFSVRGYLLLIWKDFVTHMHCLAISVKEELPFKNSEDSYLCLWLGLHHSVSYFFFLNQSPSSSFCTVFDTISSKMRFYQSTHLLMYLSLETLTSIIMTGSPIPVELIGLLSFVILFLKIIWNGYPDG